MMWWLPLIIGCGSPPAVDLGQTTWVPTSGDAVEGWVLRDAEGETVEEGDLVGQWTAVVLGYTSCPDVCPATMGGVMGAIDQTPDLDWQVWFVAVDPARDEARLGPWSEHFGVDTVRALTGEPADLSLVAEQLGGSFSVRDDGGDVVVEHSTALALIDPTGRVIGWHSRPSDAEALAADLTAAITAWTPPLSLDDAWVRPPIGERGMAAGYGRLVNHSDRAVTIEEVTSPDIGGVYVHETFHHDGVAGMRPTTLRIPAGGSTELLPGGQHLMLADTDARLEQIRFRIRLIGGDDVWVSAPLRDGP